MRGIKRIAWLPTYWLFARIGAREVWRYGVAMAGHWYLEVLGVDSGATEEEIRRAYRRLASQYHPDKNRSPFANERMQELNAALEEALKGGGVRSAVRRTRRSAQSNPGKRSSGPSPHRKDGADIKRTVHISLREAYFGCARDISISGRSVSVRIPKSAKSDDIIRMKSEGERGIHGGQHGDLLVTVQVESDQLFKRDGDNLIFEVELGHVVDFGGTINIPAFGGEISMKIPAGTKDGQTFRLSGKGMPKASDGFGDMIVVEKLSSADDEPPISEQTDKDSSTNNKWYETETYKELYKRKISSEDELAKAIKIKTKRPILLTNDIILSAALPPIESNIRINGKGFAISGDKRRRIFEIKKNGTLSIDGLILRDGKENYGGAIRNSGGLEIANCKFVDNVATGDGGAIDNRNTARMYATCCEFLSNSSEGKGGALNDSGGLIEISNCAFKKNFARFRGGGIRHAGHLNLYRSTFNRNSTDSSGGAIHNDGGAHLLASECEFSFSSAKSAGGAINDSGKRLHVANCKFMGNSAKEGGAIYYWGKTLGKTALMITESVFRNNSSDKAGGAIRVLMCPNDASLSKNQFSDNEPDDCNGID